MIRFLFVAIVTLASCGTETEKINHSEHQISTMQKNETSPLEQNKFDIKKLHSIDIEVHEECCVNAQRQKVLELKDSENVPPEVETLLQNALTAYDNQNFYVFRSSIKDAHRSGHS